MGGSDASPNAPPCWRGPSSRLGGGKAGDMYAPVTPAGPVGPDPVAPVDPVAPLDIVYETYSGSSAPPPAMRGHVGRRPRVLCGAGARRCGATTLGEVSSGLFGAGVSRVRTGVHGLGGTGWVRGRDEMTRAAATARTLGGAATGAQVGSGEKEAGCVRSILRQCIDAYYGVRACEVARVAGAALRDGRAVRVDRACLVVAGSSND